MKSYYRQLPFYPDWETSASDPVGPSPDAHVLRLLDEAVSEIRVRDADELLGPLPHRVAGQLHRSVLGNHIIHDLARDRHDGAGLAGGDDTGMEPPLLVGEGRLKADEAFPAL
jgi:hypothetical protein